MATINKFEDLEIWKIAKEICQKVFSISNKNPFYKDFSLRDQMRRSSGSIMDNISEGFERGGKKEMIQYLSISKGSSGECRSQLYRAIDRNYISKEEFDELYNMLILESRKISSLIKYLKKSDYKGTKYK
ncbi:MAG: four helix bundle protein [Bacteroidota bacterium]